jgi:putative DNA primase/helicase
MTPARPSDFLRLFYADDERICFRAFPPRGARGQVDKEYGSIASLLNGEGIRGRLLHFNRDRGIYFVVNSGGDQDADITRFNAAFVEDDKSTIQDQHRKLDVCPLPTTARVETARSVHAYWKLSGATTAQQWREVQTRLIAFFSGDPSIKNESRVMRLPGFDHIAKDGTRKTVTVVQYDPERVYTIEELLSAFPAVETEGRSNTRRNDVPTGGFATWDALRAELGRRIMAHETARKNSAGNWDCRGICHDGEGNTGLFYVPSTNQAHCNSHCEQEVILRAFGLPEKPEEKGGATGQAHPRIESIRQPDAENSGESAKTQAMPETEFSPEETATLASVIGNPNEDNVAALFEERYAQVFRYCKIWGHWLKWDQTRWQIDQTDIVFDFCRRLSRSINTEKSRTVAKRSFSVGVEGFARAARCFATVSDQWNSEDFTLNTPEHTFTLGKEEQMDTRPHRREDYITKCARVSPKSGPMPVFDQFMKDITLEDQNLIDYHQRSLGATLSGAITDHWLLFWTGKGRNGKNTLGDLLLWIMGDYAKVIPTETLMSSRLGQHPTELANLQGLRLAISSEVPEGSSWNESRIKSLTGDAMISARFMRCDFFEFRRTHKHLIYGNHRPMLRVVDDAIRARIHVVPFKATFTGDKCDPNMPAKLRKEAPQILHWLMEGHQQWYKDGYLKKCPAVEAETADYFESQNTNDKWLEERCCVDPTAEERANLLYRDFKEWKESRGEGVISQTRWGEWMSTRFPKRISAGTIYGGIRLLPKPWEFQG